MSSPHTITTGVFAIDGNTLTTGGHHIDETSPFWDNDDASRTDSPLPPLADLTHPKNLFKATDLGFMRSVVQEITERFWVQIPYYRLDRSKTMADSLWGKAKEYIYMDSITLSAFVKYKENPDTHGKYGVDRVFNTELWIPWNELTTLSFVPDLGDKYEYAGYPFVVVGASAVWESEFLTTNNYTFYYVVGEVARPGYISRDATLGGRIES